MNLVYIGDHFYSESSTSMSTIYTENGERYHWGWVQRALKKGENINIRQANDVEMKFYNEKLKEIQNG